MIEFNGKYTNAKVMIDEIDNTTAAQITEFINHKAFTNPVAIMPDCHAGKGAVIGFTMELGDKVIPNTIGVDIGCGMKSFNVGKRLFESIGREQLDEWIRACVPFGTSVRSKVSDEYSSSDFFPLVNKRLAKMRNEFQERYDYHVPPITLDEQEFKDMCKVIEVDYDRAMRSIGTLGGGNHFIEVGKSEETGDYWITIHCGSRNLGKCVADFWQRQARLKCNAPLISKQEWTEQVKVRCEKTDWAREIARYQEIYGCNKVPRGTEYLEGLDMYMYLCHMIVAQTYADINRHVIMLEILEVLDLRVGGVLPIDIIDSVHNLIDFDDWTIRKGSIRSYEGERMVIPFNMEDGLLFCEGKSNAEWNNSAPHGAGRLFSRSHAKKVLNLADAKRDMEKAGVYSSNIPLDEVKDAYKDPAIIEACIEPTATIIDRVKPVLNMKD
jgi:RNA-splicing ligase RtcB